MDFFTRRVQGYFQRKAEEYDAVSDQLYWRLSDALLWRLIISSAAPVANGRLLDVGGGTARWSLRLASSTPVDSIVVVDLTFGMLQVAQRKEPPGSTAVHYVQANLNYGLPFQAGHTGLFSGAMVLHNVIGFVKDPLKLLSGIGNCLQGSGRLWLMAPSIWHMAYFYIATGRAAELETLFQGFRGSFTQEMPEVWAFTPTRLREICELAGFVVEGVYGFPSLIYPGMGDTEISGDDLITREHLGSNSAFEQILQAELEALQVGGEAIASRGANLLVIAGKRS